jgi:hypothetical protein
MVDSSTDNVARESKGNEFKLVPNQEVRTALLKSRLLNTPNTRNENEILSRHSRISRANQTAPLIDRLHRLMRLFQQNRAAEVPPFYDAWGLANHRAFIPLLQAVRELALHDRQDTKRWLVEALATQLKLNRKIAGMDKQINDRLELGIMETDMFSSVKDSEPKSVTYRAEQKKSEAEMSVYPEKKYKR